MRCGGCVVVQWGQVKQGICYETSRLFLPILDKYFKHHNVDVSFFWEGTVLLSSWLIVKILITMLLESCMVIYTLCYPMVSG